MRQIPGRATLAILMLAALPASGAATAGEVYYLDRGENGFNLPGVTLPQGQDEVHAADGTTCRSAVGGSGTYLDVGAINSSMNADGNVATYARVVIPLGRRSSRLDCAKLYELEVERLTMELRLMKMGVAPDGPTGATKPAPEDNGRWTKDGWTDAGVRAGKR